MQITPVELKGNRVRLIPLEPYHTEALFRAGNHPEIWTYMTSPMNNPEDMEKIITHALAQKEKGLELPFVVIDQESDEVIGSTRFLNVSRQNRSLEIGSTWYTPRVWRSPVNTECKYLLLRHSFEKLHALRVQIKTDSRNLRAQKAIERLGAVKEGTLRNERILYNGYIRDAVYYSIIDEEWPAIKRKLESFLSQSGEVPER
ncbi:GNAT family N-acetyltransferase [Paenactinomyces guangxiensis]|uniref:GNAT family N-acetyltransferase n=1 Tax=Paenactinomyces guangxiensis TaxID=1490290 RepID=A0A7W2A7J3_9BACL|nr:GNAT family protein [Paenactinomyces guangxiensis]MBA4494626.1 GNAT family N-acetyltransferase [Paenactinomyces guangxiensis]MBH8591611.1 GNAT family N-acetyltransferase [Paenactinomyces guangxiensis]